MIALKGVQLRFVRSISGLSSLTCIFQSLEKWELTSLKCTKFFLGYLKGSWMMLLLAKVSRTMDQYGIHVSTEMRRNIFTQSGVSLWNSLKKLLTMGCWIYSTADQSMLIYWRNEGYGISAVNWKWSIK